MELDFFKQPILNSQYEYPAKHWKLDKTGQPTNRIVEDRRRAEFITPIPKPKKQRGKPAQPDSEARRRLEGHPEPVAGDPRDRPAAAALAPPPDQQPPSPER